MPAILTHLLFGIDVHNELGHVIGASPEARDAFLLGNQGPDPLLSLKALPPSAGFRNIGTTMHTASPAKLLAAVHKRLVESRAAREARELPAFALGFLCHYLLDSTAHPLVYAQQNAICEAGVEGLGAERAGRIVHALIEAEIDEYVLSVKRGVTVESFRPHREALPSSESELRAISSALGAATGDAYDLEMPAPAFALSVHLYRNAQHVIDERRNLPHLPQGLRRLIGDSYLHFEALTHSIAPNGPTMFANRDHAPWPHPFAPDAVMNASFDELYSQAFERALETLPEFARSDFSAEDCAALTSNVDFYGRRITASD